MLTIPFLSLLCHTHFSLLLSPFSLSLSSILSPIRIPFSLTLFPSLKCNTLGKSHPLCVFAAPPFICQVRMRQCATQHLRRRAIQSYCSMCMAPAYTLFRSGGITARGRTRVGAICMFFIALGASNMN